VGFELITYKVSPGEDIGRMYVFNLQAKTAMLQDILILPDATRKKYLRLFIENFLGITEEGATSKLPNIDAIYFTKDPGDRYGFSAHCDTPLLIINKMLGYKIYFQLHEFNFNEATGASSFFGYTRYEEMGDKKRWIKNRRKAYFGSSMHFFRSLISNKLAENSYKVFVVRTDTMWTPNHKVDKTMDIAIPSTAGQIIRREETDTTLYRAIWKNKLMVQYGKDPGSKVYLKQHTMLNGDMPLGFRSYLLMVKEENFVEIDQNGILLDPMAVFFSGYWIYEKAANLLPYNYEPENN
jgi:hypothetical protein